MKELIQEFSYTLLLLGTLIGFVLGVLGGFAGRSDPVVILWKGALGACFGAFLLRIFLAVVMMNLRQNAEERSAEKLEEADITDDAKSNAASEP